MANWWGNNGKSERLFFFGSKITADGDWSHETWKKSYNQPRQHIFPVVIYGCENWTIKKAKCRRINAFELWCWRRLFRVPWTARRSNQSIIKEISPECSLKGLMLKLKFQYLATWCKELTHWKRPWCWERLRAGREGDDRGWDGWMASLMQWTWIWAISGSWWWTGKPGMLWFMTEWLNWLNWGI